MSLSGYFMCRLVKQLPVSILNMYFKKVLIE